MKNYVKDKAIVITGGSSGFGLEAARLALELGASVAITGRNKEKLDQAAAELASPRLLTVRADATREEDWKLLIEQTLKRFGRIDVLVNNHGAGIKIAPLEEQNERLIREALDVNLASVITGCREVIPIMKRGKRGHIINVSSACAHHSWPSWSVYTAAKAGLVAFTRCLHLEMVPWGGKATSFIPGAARTGFSQAANIDGSWMKGFPTGEDFARSLVHCIDVPDHCFIEELNIWGTQQVLNPF